MKNILAIMTLSLFSACGSISAPSSLSGGGGQGQHYLCGSEELALRFQLNDRPTAGNFQVGSKVLVALRNRPGQLWPVQSFSPGSSSDPTTSLKLSNPEAAQPELDWLSVTWQGNSILDNIKLERVVGMRANRASDGVCVFSPN